MEDELTTRPVHPSSTPVFSGVCVARSFVFCVMFCRPLFLILVPLLLAIILSVLLRFKASGYPFDISELFLHEIFVYLGSIWRYWMVKRELGKSSVIVRLALFLFDNRLNVHKEGNYS